jgi:hypothetical protein
VSEKNFAKPFIVKIKLKNTRLIFIKDLEMGVLFDEPIPASYIKKTCKIIEKLVILSESKNMLKFFVS